MTATVSRRQPPRAELRQCSEADKARFTGLNHSPYRPVLLVTGTVVTVTTADGGRVRGVVQRYAPEWSHGGFPVRFDHTGQWRTMLITDVTVVAAPDTEGNR